MAAFLRLRNFLNWKYDLLPTMKKYSFQKVTVNYSAVKGRVTKYRAELPWIVLGNEWFDQEEADPPPFSSSFTPFERCEASLRRLLLYSVSPILSERYPLDSKEIPNSRERVRRSEIIPLSFATLSVFLVKLSSFIRE